MNVEFVYKGYNTRRYSKPWGAKIKLSGNKLEYDFSVGNYLGDGAGGAVVIECNVGDVVATGQRDGRGGNTKHEIYIVKEGGELEEVDRKGAYDHLKANKDVSPLSKYTDEDLLAEIKKRGLIK